MASNMFVGLKLKDKPVGQEPAGRKTGKSSDPNYRSTTVYLKKETVKKAQVKLIENDSDFSTLVENLVQDWIDKN
jgi:hypothetical protein